MLISFSHGESRPPCPAIGRAHDSALGPVPKNLRPLFDQGKKHAGQPSPMTTALLPVLESTGLNADAFGKGSPEQSRPTSNCHSVRVRCLEFMDIEAVMVPCKQARVPPTPAMILSDTLFISVSGNLGLSVPGPGIRG